MELARHVPSEQWTLVGGLMVQLHAAVAGMPFTHTTGDVDVILHVETGAVKTAGVRAQLEALGYELQKSLDHRTPAHRFKRGTDQIDVMIADHPAPRVVTTLGCRPVVKAPGGMQALQRSVNCRIGLPDDEPVVTSVPNTLGALVLKGAAYIEDSRDAGRHLDDGAVLLATVTDPWETRSRMKGSDRGRIRAPQRGLKDPTAESWLVLDPEHRRDAMNALAILAADPPA